jgi:nitrous oxidase accessory protein NosD
MRTSKSSIALTALAAVGLVILAPALALAQKDIYVPADSPTIQGAIDMAAPGDTIRVSPGVYAESINFGGKDVSVRSTDGPASTTLRRADIWGVDIASIGPGGALNGFTVEGGLVSVFGDGSVIRGNTFIRTNTGVQTNVIAGTDASPIIEANRFIRPPGTDVWVDCVDFFGASSPTIANNIFEDQATAVAMIVSPEGRPLVVNNTFLRNSTAIFVSADSVSTSLSPTAGRTWARRCPAPSPSGLSRTGAPRSRSSCTPKTR